MSRLWIKGIWFGVFAFLAVLVFASGTSYGAAFMKFDGIDGESTDDKHDKWIDVLSTDWGIHKPGGGATGQTRRRAFTMVHEVDASSAKLLEAACNGTDIPSATVEIEVIVPSDGSGPPRSERYYRWVLKDVQVTSYNVGGTGGEGDVPVEEITLGYTEVEWTYISLRDGVKVAEESASCKLPEPPQ